MFNNTKVNVSNGSLHVVESGSSQDPAVLFLHGWPENWSAYEQLMQLTGKKVHALSVDLPGIGESNMQGPPSTKRDIAECIHELVEALQLKRLTLLDMILVARLFFRTSPVMQTNLNGQLL